MIFFAIRKSFNSFCTKTKHFSWNMDMVFSTTSVKSGKTGEILTLRSYIMENTKFWVATLIDCGGYINFHSPVSSRRWSVVTDRSSIHVRWTKQRPINKQVAIKATTWIAQTSKGIRLSIGNQLIASRSEKFKLILFLSFFENYFWKRLKLSRKGFYKNSFT